MPTLFRIIFTNGETSYAETEAERDRKIEEASLPVERVETHTISHTTLAEVRDMLPPKAN